MAGASVTEVAIYLNRSGSYVIDNAVFDTVNITKTGATAPTLVINASYADSDHKFLNIRDAITADATAVNINSGQYTSTYVRPGTLLDNTGTPSVAGGSVFVTSGNTTITDFTGASTHQIITILFNHTSVTVTNSSTLHLAGAASYTFNTTDSLSLVWMSGAWNEISRSDNSV